MVSKDFKIKNKSGFHMRAAMVFTNAMANYSSDINIKYGAKNINGKSIINIMVSKIYCGSKITVQCSGTDENEMLLKAGELIENGFYETGE